MAQRIEWTARALDDLHGIYSFIARDSKRYAHIQVNRIQAAVSRLGKFPLMGRRLPEFPHLPYRENCPVTIAFFTDLTGSEAECW